MAEPWIRVHANLSSKPVIRRCAAALGVNYHEAMGLMVEFWGSVSQNAVDGSLRDVTDEQIEKWAGWRKKPRGKFAAFVKESHLDLDRRVNEWDEYAGSLELRRAKDRIRQEERRKRLKAERDSLLSRGPSAGRHAERHADGHASVTQKSVPARANEDETKTKRDELQLPPSPAREELLRRVPNPPAWAAELEAARQGMHGPQLTEEQIELACRDYLGNGAIERPTLKHFRGYLRRAAQSERAPPRAADPEDALDKWYREKKAQEAQPSTNAGSPHA